MVNQAKVEEMEDEQILMLAESDKNKYEMPETNVENLAYESKMINIVIGKVHQIYTDVTSDMLINLKTHIQTQSKQLSDVFSKTMITTSGIERFCFFLCFIEHE